MATAFNVRWQASRSTILERNRYMFNNPVMSDIKFAFPNHDKRVIPAHKYVLAISSPVFFAMFYGGLREKKETIDITDCDPEIFLQFLRFLYCDDANFRNVNNAIQLWYLADKYDVPPLATKCVNFVDGAMDPLNAFAIIPYARRFSHLGLEETCWEVIDYNAKDIIAGDSFLELKHDFVLHFVERSSLHIDHEVSLFKAVDRWATRRCEEANMAVDGANKRSVLGEDLVKNVRFSLMSPQEFSDVVIPSEILSKTEIIDVFKQLTSVSVPGGLMFSTVRRIKCDDHSKHSSRMSMGKIHHTKQARADLGAAQSGIPKRKTGVLTLTVNKPGMLFGVKIVTDKVRRSRVSLSVSRRGETIRQIKPSKNFVTKTIKEYGEIDVFFNRPLHLTNNTCYTIETDTDTTERETCFVCSPSLQESIQKSRGWTRFDPGFDFCSGRYTACLPMNVGYKGEVILLFYDDIKESKNALDE